MGGLYDSSYTRAHLVFRARSARETPWLQRLLLLREHGAPDAERLQKNDLTPRPPLVGENECRLAAPPSVLRWLVQHATKPNGWQSSGSDVDRDRERLFRRDPEMIRFALDLLANGELRRGWQVLEGPTARDVSIETPDAIVVIEGKRTEADPTTSTNSMLGWHQMWRRIDAAWESRENRRVAGFLIVESKAGEDIPAHLQAAANATWGNVAMEQSLPHRSPQEREQLRNCFLGASTWQRVVREFKLPSNVLRHERVNKAGS